MFALYRPDLPAALRTERRLAATLGYRSYLCRARLWHLVSILFLILLSTSAWADKTPLTPEPVKTGNTGWREVMREHFEQRTIYTWCDASSILIWMSGGPRPDGTIPIAKLYHIDIKTGKKIIVVDVPNIKLDTYCSHDGRNVFYETASPNESTGQTWVYDLVSGKRQKVGRQLTDYFKVPVSPREKIFIVNAGRAKNLSSWKQEKINLPGWTILWFPRKGQEGAGGWTREGTYFMVGGYLYNQKGELINDFLKRFADTHPDVRDGVKIRESLALRDDGFYFVDEFYRVHRFDLLSGKLDALPVRLYDGKKSKIADQSPTYAMDLSSQGEIAYYALPPLFTALTPGDVHFRVGDTRLYLTTLSGAPPVVLSEQGGPPKFSPDGNYISFFIEKRFFLGKKTFHPDREKDPGYELVVLQRLTQIRQAD